MTTKFSSITKWPAHAAISKYKKLTLRSAELQLDVKATFDGKYFASSKHTNEQKPVGSEVTRELQAVLKEVYPKKF